MFFSPNSKKAGVFLYGAQRCCRRNMKWKTPTCSDHFDWWCSLHTRLQKLPISYKHGSLTWIQDLNRTNDLSQLRMLRLGWKPVASSFFCKGGPFRAEPDCRFSYNPPGFTLPAYASQRLGHKQKSTEKNMRLLKSKTLSEVLGYSLKPKRSSTLSLPWDYWIMMARPWHCHGSHVSGWSSEYLHGEMGPPSFLGSGKISTPVSKKSSGPGWWMTIIRSRWFEMFVALLWTKLGK